MRIAQKRSKDRARRPKTGKLGRCAMLRAVVQALLGKRYSRAQIAGALAATYPDRAQLQVSHEIIYKTLYVQRRGELRRELTMKLPHRSGPTSPRDTPPSSAPMSSTDFSSASARSSSVNGPSLAPSPSNPTRRPDPRGDSLPVRV